MHSNHASWNNYESKRFETMCQTGGEKTAKDKPKSYLFTIRRQVQSTTCLQLPGDSRTLSTNVNSSGGLV